MKLDIVQAWKDQTYRQSLNDEQIAVLPAHPVGELVDAELDTIHAGSDAGPFGGPAWGPLGISSTSGASTVHREVHVHTFATVCDANTFSATQTQTPGVLNFLFHALQGCVNNS